MRVVVVPPAGSADEDVLHEADWVVVTDGNGVEFELSLEANGTLNVVGVRGRPVVVHQTASNSYDISEVTP